MTRLTIVGMEVTKEVAEKTITQQLPLQLKLQDRRNAGSMSSVATPAFVSRDVTFVMVLLIAVEVSNFEGAHELKFHYRNVLQARTRKIAPQTELTAVPMNSVVEAMEIACQWKNIATALSIVLTEVTKTAHSRQTPPSYRTMIAKQNRDSSSAMTLASH